MKVNLLTDLSGLRMEAEHDDDLLTLEYLLGYCMRDVSTPDHRKVVPMRNVEAREWRPCGPDQTAGVMRELGGVREVVYAIVWVPPALPRAEMKLLQADAAQQLAESLLQISNLLRG